jgi:hypothetical protein
VHPELLACWSVLLSFSHPHCHKSLSLAVSLSSPGVIWRQFGHLVPPVGAGPRANAGPVYAPGLTGGRLVYIRRGRSLRAPGVI